jgi:hypothetical protein
VSFTTPRSNGAGRVDFRWERPGDTIRFELDVETTHTPHQVRAELWCNADRDDGAFACTAMEPVGHGLSFRADLPVRHIGNYRALGRIVGPDGAQVAEREIQFRPRDPSLEALDIELVSIPNANAAVEPRKVPGTFADLMEPGSPSEGGRYTLEWLRGRGKNCLWILPPFPASTLVKPSAVDDGSPYAIQDFFGVDTRLARSARGLSGIEAERAAKVEFLAFLERAHALGMKVLIDLPLNHLGFGHRFRDLFVSTGPDGAERREVRSRDFTNLELAPEDALSLEERLADPSTPKVLEALAPFLYGSKRGRIQGAASMGDIASGGWFEWRDTLQLNHGRRRVGYQRFEDQEPTPSSRAVIGWLIRVLRFWAVDMGVDGFRIDHLAGTPLELLERGLNEVQRDVDRHSSSPRRVIVIGEDFDTPQRTRHFVDFLQSGTFRELAAVRTPADLERIVEDPHHHSLLSLSSHDEDRFATAFGDDLEGATFQASVLLLLGGPVLEVMGDAFGERERLPFKQIRPVRAIASPTEAGSRMAEKLKRVGRLRCSVPALRRADRAWLRPRDGGEDRDLLVLSRCVRPAESEAIVVAANFHPERGRENVFRLDPALLDWLGADAKYQVRDLLDSEPARLLWPTASTKRDLLDRGIFFRLGPRQIQVLSLSEVNSRQSTVDS